MGEDEGGGEIFSDGDSSDDEVDMPGNDTTLTTQEDVENLEDSPPHSTSDEMPADLLSEVFDERIKKELKDHRYILNNFLIQLINHGDAVYFNEPVDPIKHDCPTYFDVIKEPMDLSTMNKKLNSPDSEYLKDPRKFISDFRLIVRNAILFNDHTMSASVARCAERLQDFFDKQINHYMREIKMCCGEDLNFRTRALACYAYPANGCHIARDVSYESYEDQYSVCDDCFSKAAKNEPVGGLVCVKIFKNQSDPDAIEDTELVAIDSFQRKQNDHQEPEKFVTCEGLCKRQFHEICVNYPPKIYQEPFLCNLCKHLNNVPEGTPTNKFRAPDLPTNCLSRFIERRVRWALSKVGCSSENVRRLHVRVISSADKTFVVKDKMKEQYSTKNEFPNSFPYRSKSIFAFQEHEGADICIFGMHVNEYSHEAASPNYKQVYISYLDSVFFFEPSHLKSLVYREIILSYIDYIKTLGYNDAFIWSCPPSQGDDYIFYAHPAEQKIPKSQRLLNWYKEILDTAVCRKYISQWGHMKTHPKIASIKKVTELPYFDGDFWPQELEKAIKETKELEEQQLQNNNLPLQGNEVARVRHNSDSSTHSSTSNWSLTSNKNKRRRTKEELEAEEKAMSGPKTFEELMLANIRRKISEQADVFFCLQLREVPNMTDTIHDPDPILNCPLFDGRENFLWFCRINFYEFSTRRRAKYTTTCFLKPLHEKLALEAGELASKICHTLNCNSESVCQHPLFPDCSSLSKNYLAKDIDDPGMILIKRYSKPFVDHGFDAKQGFLRHLMAQYLKFHRSQCVPSQCTSIVCITTRHQRGESSDETAN